MTKDKIKVIVDKYKSDLAAYVPKRHPPYMTLADWPRASMVCDHLVWMLEQIPELDHDKAMRWLGFVQGALWAIGKKSIDEMKADNRSH